MIEIDTITYCFRLVLSIWSLFLFASKNTSIAVFNTKCGPIFTVEKTIVYWIHCIRSFWNEIKLKKRLLHLSHTSSPWKSITLYEFERARCVKFEWFFSCIQNTQFKLAAAVICRITQWKCYTIYEYYKLLQIHSIWMIPLDWNWLSENGRRYCHLCI